MLAGIRSKLAGAKAALVGGGLALTLLAGSAAPVLVPAAAASPNPNSLCYQLGLARGNAIQLGHVFFYMGDRENVHVEILWANELLRRAQVANCAGAAGIPPETDPYYW